MKTLDEVIAELEDEGLFPDALHYLKEYRSDRIQWEADRKNWQDQYARAVENFKSSTAKHLEALKEIKGIIDPLTWDELRTMEGKPVWVEWQDQKEWFLIDSVDKKKVVFRSQSGFGWYCLRRENESWQAYRKERS